MMKRILLYFLTLLSFTSLYAKNNKVKVYRFDELEPLLLKDNDTTYIVHFWATWCAPCINEIPVYKRIEEEFADKKIKVLLVSLDFTKQIKDKLIPFLKRLNIQSEVLVLNDPDSNSWINQVHNSWSGAIPATLIYNGNRREFFEKSLTYDEIVSLLNQKKE